MDLGTTKTIQEIRLTVIQSPAGPTTHRIWGSATGVEGSWQLLTIVQGNTSEGQILNAVLPTKVSGIRFIKVETTESPSWVAWSEIDVRGY